MDGAVVDVPVEPPALIGGGGMLCFRVVMIIYSMITT